MRRRRSADALPQASAFGVERGRCSTLPPSMNHSPAKSSIMTAMVVAISARSTRLAKPLLGRRNHLRRTGVLKR
jgi:hypothetical protein